MKSRHVLSTTVLLAAICGITSCIIFPPVNTLPPEVSTVPIFQDDFNGWSDAKWSHRQLGVRNHCINTKDAVSVKDGKLIIKTYSEPDAQGKLQNYCGMVSTSGKFEFTYGYWEAAIRISSAPGVQLAFWVQSDKISEDPSNPEKSGVEMDVFEHVAESPAENFDLAFHWGGYGEHHKSWKKRFVISPTSYMYVGLLWTKEGYKLYVNSALLATIASSEVPVSTAKQYIIISSEVPRSFPPEGYGDRHTAKTDFEIHSVAVYPLVTAP